MYSVILFPNQNSWLLMDMVSWEPSIFICSFSLQQDFFQSDPKVINIASVKKKSQKTDTVS